MDVHRARIVRRFGIIKPPIIRKPAPLISHRNQIASPRMIQTGQRPPHPVDDMPDSRHRLHNRFHLRMQRLVIEIQMRHLMIRHRKHFAGPGIEYLRPDFITPRNPAVLAKDPV